MAENHPHILVVDDDAYTRITLESLLTEEGYQVDTAKTGEAAVEMCREKVYDVLLMDVRMPGIDGVEAFRQIRQYQEHVPVIFMSVHTVDELQQKALREGAIAFLPKPFEFATILRLIKEGKQPAILVMQTSDKRVQQLQETLQRQGFRVTTAASPMQALDLAEQIHFDLVFLDGPLGGMGSLDLYVAIKEVTPTVTAIMAAGLEQHLKGEIAKPGQEDSFTLVSKPLDKDSLLEYLKQLVGQPAA